MTTITASRARGALPEILDRVLAGEEVTITRHGEPVAVIVRPDAIRMRRDDHSLRQAEHVHHLLVRGRTRRLDDAAALTPERADQLVADLRSARTT